MGSWHAIPGVSMFLFPTEACNIFLFFLLLILTDPHIHIS